MLRFVCLALFSLSPLVSAQSSWMLIDDFQQWNASEIYTNATEIGWYAKGEFPEFWILADPYDATNVALYVPPALYASHYSNLFVMKELPDGGIPPGKSGSIYFECLFSGGAFSWHIGTSDKPTEYDPVSGLLVSPGAWDDFNALIRLKSETNVFEHRDADQYVATNPPLSPVPNKWYKFVLQVDNSWDMSASPPISTGIYTLYMRGPEIGNRYEWTLIPVATEPAKDSAFFQRHPRDAEGNPRAITWVMFATNPGEQTHPAKDPFLLDNFYFSHGSTIPIEGDPIEWSCWEVINEIGDINTGSFLGWINMIQDPYLWSYSLDGWIYMQEPACDAPGAWAYFYK